MASGLAAGDAAIVPTITFLATANAVRMTGAEVVFADVDPNSGLLTPSAFADALKRASHDGHKVKAVLPVHLNGQICDLEGLAEVAVEAGAVLIEDACHALGVTGVGACVNSIAACFSTHPVKAIATGEGGVVTTSDAMAAKKMRQFRSHGMVREHEDFRLVSRAFDQGIANPWYYEMHEIGWNYRMPDILCAIGSSQLKKLTAFQTRRREIASLYDDQISRFRPLLRPVKRTGSQHGWHIYAVQIDYETLGMTRRFLMERLRASNIGTQVHYAPVHAQPYYANRYGKLKLAGAEAYYERCLSLPFYPSMTDSDVERVVFELGKLLRS